MAEEAEDASDEEEADGKSAPAPKSKKKIIIIAGAVGLLAVVGAALYFTGILGGNKGKSAAIATVEMPPPSIHYEFPEILVDLTTKGRRTRFIKIKVVAEISAVDKDAIDQSELAIIDGFQTHLRGQTSKDLSGKEGTEKLREVFVTIVNRAIAPAAVRNILFRQIILQ